MDINHPADSPLSSYHNLFPQIVARRESIDKIVPVSRRPSACSTVILVNDREQQVGDDFEENSPVARELSPSPTDEQKKKLFSRRNIVPKLTKAASTLSASFASPNSQQTSTWNSVTNLIKNKAGVGGSHKDSINSCRESELAVRTSKNQRSNSTITVVATVELGNHEPNENATITSGPRHNAVTALAAQMSNERRQQDKPRLSFQRLRKVRVGTSGISSSRRATASSSRGVERGTMFHEEGVGSGNENESRAGSSYGIRNLLSHLNPSTESAGGTLSERLEKSFTKEELRDYQQMFEMFDTDGSGALGNEELKEAIISIGLQANDSEIDEIIREVDEDGNGEIDFEEFCHCMKKSQNLVTRASNEEIARQCFEVFDQDGNGLITENEFVYVAKEVGGFSQELAEFVFHELDISSNGHLSADQFSAIVEDYLLSDNKSET